MSLTRTSFSETIAEISEITALRSLTVFLVDGSYMPRRLKSPVPVARAMRILTSSIVELAGTSMEAGSFLIGCFGAFRWSASSPQLYFCFLNNSYIYS